jgi:hypothetical protein
LGLIYEGRRVFTRGRLTVVGVCVATALFGAAAVVTVKLRGWTWVSIGMAAAVAFGFAGMIETLVERVVLEDEALVIRRLWGTRRYSIADIDRVEEAKGVVPAIRLKDGRWVKLPDVVPHFGNSARAWLRAHRADTPPPGAA